MNALFKVLEFNLSKLFYGLTNALCETSAYPINKPNESTKKETESETSKKNPNKTIQKKKNLHKL